MALFVALFSYLTAKGYRVAIINPLLIANFAKLSFRCTIRLLHSRFS